MFLTELNIFQNDSLRPFVLVETEGFKIDTMGTYHGMTLKSVTVRPLSSDNLCFSIMLSNWTVNNIAWHFNEQEAHTGNQVLNLKFPFFNVFHF